MKKFVLILALFLGLGCQQKKDIGILALDNINLYQEYLAEVSHGIVSADADVRVVLKVPLDQLVGGQELDKDLLRVSPKVAGKVVALDGRTIAFIPEKGLQQDTAYEFTFNLGKLIPEVPQELREFRFGIQTVQQQFAIYTQALQSYSKEYQYLDGQLKSADKLDLETAQKLVVVSQNGKSLPIKFSPGVTSGTLFQFKIDSIQRFEEDSQLLVLWDGKPFGIDSKGENTLAIPGKSHFVVLDVMVASGVKPAVLINFSDPLKKGQNFKGLVTLEGDPEPKYAIDGNVLKVYPSIEITGTTTLNIYEGIQSADGYRLKADRTEQIAFEQIKPEVRLLSNGSILPSSHNLKINFEAVNLKAVHVSVYRIFENNVLQFLQGNNLDGNYDLKRVARPIAEKRIELINGTSLPSSKWVAHALDLRALITPEPGAIYRVEFNIKPDYSLYSCASTNFDPERDLGEDYDTESENSNWDGAEAYYEGYYYNYNWNERENPCNTSYYYDKTVGVNVLASDIGVTIKNGGNNNYFVAANDIISTAPLAGAQVAFYNYQQQALGTVTTDQEGTARYRPESMAYFAVVTHQGQKTYVRLNDGNALSVSKFKVDGMVLQKGLKGFIFGERGVWRPGDPIHLSFMLNDHANSLPPGHPVKLEFMDPYHKVVYREIKTQGLDNFYHFELATDENAPTGNWTVRISVGGAVFSEVIKIETIKPNRLKIKTEFSEEILSGTAPIKANLEVAWLHGAVAKNLKADITAKFTVRNTEFKDFPGYVFNDLTQPFSVEEQIVFQGKVNEMGKASFTLEPKFTARAPGMLNAAFVAKVYETGGDFSTDVFTKPYSPYSTYVGLSAPLGDKARGMLLTDEPHTFNVVTVNEAGKAVVTRDLKVAIYKINWRWWWETSQDNLSNYYSDQYQEKVFEETIHTGANGKGTFTFELKYPDWGRYLVRVEDPKGLHATAQIVYVDWPGWAGKSRKNDPSAATMLVFSTDKETYNVGETATVTFPSSEGGRALVTLENGKEVLQSFWVQTAPGETKFQIPITDPFAPNVYIGISLLQPHANTINDSPIRMYGVVPIMVENPATRLAPEIVMPDVLRPEERITVKVREQQGKAMTYSIAMVDEGLLDLTRFKTPDPWAGFYVKEALGVKSWDVYDDVIGAFGGRIDQVFAIGGDGDLEAAKNQKANRFKPVVTYMGPFSLGEGKTGIHEIDIPKYVGSVRTMVVAGNSKIEAYGKAEKTTPVRKPLMVLASLPRKITPGETVTLPVTVFAMEDKIKEVALKIKPHPSFTLIGEAVQRVSFTGPDEKMAYFQLKVADFKGIGEIVVEASGNGEQASFSIPIDVVNPNPVTNQKEDYILEPKGSQAISLSTFGVSGTNSAQIELSTLPPMNFNGRMQFLIQYPHGCLEQITSGAFPQLFLSDIFEINSNKKKEIQQNVEGTIKRLGAYQLPSGGLSYWPGQQAANDWSSTYVGHFLLEAEKKGFVLPIGFKSSWVKYQQNAAKQWQARSSASDLVQAYRLYTLAFSGNADVASMNRLREVSGLSNEAKYRLAAAYALIGQGSVAEQIIKDARYDQDNARANYDTFGSSDRNKAMALEVYVLMGNKAQAQELAKMLAHRLAGDQWMSTQTTAYSLLAMAKFAEMVGGRGIAASVKLNGSDIKVETSKTLAQEGLGIRNGSNEVVLTNNGDNTLYVSIINSGILPVGEERAISRNLVATVAYKGRDGSPLNPGSLSQGTNFIAEVTLTNTQADEIKNIALTEIFPSGWEIVNTRFTDFGEFAENQVTYTDLRDDRANFYFDMEKNGTQVVRILLNASYLGKYYLPGIQAEAMYDNNFMVRTRGQWVEVIP